MEPARLRRSSTCSRSSGSSRDEGGPRMSGTVLAFIEHANGEPDRLSLEALSLARALAATLGVPVEAVLVVGGAEAGSGRLGTYGGGLVHVAADAMFDDYAPAAWAAAIREVMDARGPDAVIAAGSDRGSEVLAHVAARAGLPLA